MESFAELPRFLAGLKDVSPGTEYKLIVDDNYEQGTCTFKSVFWAFRPCIVGKLMIAMATMLIIKFIQ